MKKLLIISLLGIKLLVNSQQSEFIVVSSLYEIIVSSLDEIIIIPPDISLIWANEVIADLQEKNDNLIPVEVISELEIRLLSNYVMPDASDNYFKIFGDEGLNIRNSSWLLPFQITGSLFTTLHEFSGAHETLVWNFGDEVITSDNITATDEGARIITLTSADIWTNLTSFELEVPAQTQNFTGVYPALNSLPDLEEAHFANCQFTDVSPQIFDSQLFHFCGGNNTFLAKPSPVIIAPGLTHYFWQGATWSVITMGNFPLLVEFRASFGFGARTGGFPTITAAAYPNLQQVNFTNSYYTDANDIQVAKGLGIQLQGTAIPSLPDLASVAPNSNGIEALRLYSNSSLTTITDPVIPYFGSNTNNVLVYNCALTQASTMILLNMLDDASVTNLASVRFDGGTNWAFDATAISIVASIEARNSGLTILYN